MINNVKYLRNHRSIIIYQNMPNSKLPFLKKIQKTRGVPLWR